MPLKIHCKDLTKRKTLRIYSLRDFSSRKRVFDLGNKANSQIKLFRLGYNIPPCIFLDYSFFDYFTEKKALAPEVIDLLVSANLGEKLAVRSSSNVEDSPTESFAGFFKTILNVANDHYEIKQAISECYKSHPSRENPYLNSGRSRLRDQPMRMGVVLQPMIEAKFSGVIFTHSPQNPPNNSYRIEYCAGTGDKLTGSYVTGYVIILDKATGKIIQQKDAILLNENEIHALWQKVKDLEEKFQFPQDVEFVISEKEHDIFFLQSRPITAFSYTPEYVLTKETERIKEIFMDSYTVYGRFPVLSSSNVSELFPSASPLGYSLFKTIFAGTSAKIGAINAGRRALGYAPISRKEQTELFLTVGNQARVNLLIDALTFRLEGMEKEEYSEKAIGAYLLQIKENPVRANYPEGEVYLQAPSREECEAYFGARGYVYYELYHFFLKILDQQKIPALIASIAPKRQRHEAYYRHELVVLTSRLQKISLSSLQHKLNEYTTYLRKDICVLYVKVARVAFLSAYIVKKCLADLLKDSPVQLFDGMLTGHDQQTPNLVDRIFDMLLAQENCPENFKAPNQQEFMGQIKAERKSLSEFLSVFGHIGSLDLMQPRLSEISEATLNLLVQAHPVPQSDEKHKVKVEDIYSKLEVLLPGRTNELKEWVTHASTFMALRETLKFEFLKILYLIKKLIIELQRRFDLHELIYFLEWDELESLERKALNKYRLRAMQRKAYYDACGSLRVKTAIRDFQEENLSKNGPIVANDGRSYKEVDGNTIHYGEAEGICLIAGTTQEYYEKLVEYHQQGIDDIIGFFKGLELSYSQLNELNGLVTEHGGYLAHAATIARENNIPYISNVPIDYFKDGYYVILDTSNHKVIYREVV